MSKHNWPMTSTGWYALENRPRTIAEEQEYQDILSTLRPRITSNSRALAEALYRNLPRESTRTVSDAKSAHRALFEDEPWDPVKHPRTGSAPNPGWFASTGGVGGGGGQTSNGGLLARSQAKFQIQHFQRPIQAGETNRVRGQFVAQQSAAVTQTGSPDSAEQPQEELTEKAGNGPATTPAFCAKVQLALGVLDPQVAQWWKANSVQGEIKSRQKGWFSSNADSWMDNKTPVVEVDANMTAGETAQAIIAIIRGPRLGNAIGDAFQSYKFAQNPTPEAFQEWQRKSLGEAAHVSSVLAELYYGSIASVSSAGDLTVTLGDVAENGLRWNQLASILPFVPFLPIANLFVQVGKFKVKIPPALAKKFALFTEAERKGILLAASKIKQEAKATAFIEREVAAAAKNRQIHHAISAPVYWALENHKNLKGIYEYRDARFVRLAKDLKSHVGYQEWHRRLDNEIVDWLAENEKATEEMFEKMLRDRYGKPDLLDRFPSPF